MARALTTVELMAVFKANGRGNAVRLVLGSVATVAVLAACSSPRNAKWPTVASRYEEAASKAAPSFVPAGLSTPPLAAISTFRPT